MLDSREYKLVVVMLADAVSHDLASSSICSGCQITDPALIDHTSHITAPHLMGLCDAAFSLLTGCDKDDQLSNRSCSVWIVAMEDTN